MAQRKLQMGITIKVTVPTLLTVGLICLAVRVSAQTSNSVNSDLSASEEPVLLRGPVSRYTDERSSPLGSKNNYLRMETK